MSNKQKIEKERKKEKYKERDIIANRFEILTIFKGGMGIVYICYDIEKKKVIALKTFQSRFVKSKRIKDAFKREALAWVHLEKHPYIVSADYVMNIDERPHIALEYITPDDKGRNTLSHYFKSPIPMEKALKWGIEFCHGMEYAASKGLTSHRDIKPDNIMITIDKVVKITDFGIAKLWDEEETQPDWSELKEKTKHPGLTFINLSYSQGEAVGTFPWMAPEQFNGTADKRSDIYSFGIVLHQMVRNGARPFSATTVSEYYQAHLNKEIEKFDSILYPIIKKCLEKSPSDRYQNFQELRLDLELIYENVIGNKPPPLPSKKDLQAWELFNKGASFYVIGFLDEAIKTFKEAIRIKFDYAECYHQIGMVLMEQNLISEAIEQFKQALKIIPYFINARLSLGNAFEVNSKIYDAIQEYKEIIRIKKDFAEAHYKLGKAYENAGDFANAMVTYKNFLKYAPKREKKYIKLVNIQIQGLKKDLESKTAMKEIHKKDQKIQRTYQKTQEIIKTEKKKTLTAELNKLKIGKREIKKLSNKKTN